MKSEARYQAKKTIERLPPAYCREVDRRITRLLAEMPEYRAAGTVFCFVGTAGEIDTRPFLEQVLADGKKLAVPLCTGKGTMAAKEIASLDELARGKYGIPEPPEGNRTVPVGGIGFAVIPCLASDRRGNRLGRGGGYYDRYFAGHTDVPAAVVCRERLICDSIPMEETDVVFGVTVTEDGVFRAGGEGKICR